MAMNVWELKRGDLFKIASDPRTWRFDRMDGMYCLARDVETGKVLHWSGPVDDAIEGVES